MPAHIEHFHRDRRSALRHWISAVVLTMVVLAGTAATVSAATFQEDVQSSVESRVKGLVESSRAGDPMYFQNAGDGGVWRMGATTCSRCQLGPAAAAAHLSGGRYDEQVRRTVTRYLGRVQADGSIPSADATGNPTPINTMFSLRDLEAIVMAMGDRLDSVTRSKWVAAIVRSARYLIASGETRWYPNGNLSVGYAAVLGIAAHLSGAADLEQAYADTWAFAHDPGATFPGQGFVETTAPTRADGRDGAGYFTENGAGGTGFDAHYTQVQLEAVTQLWLARREPATLRVLTMLAGQLRPRIDTGWMLDTSEGARHPGTGLAFPAHSPGFAIAAACDADAKARTRSQFDAASTALDWSLDERKVADNEFWAEYFGSSVAFFAAVPEFADCTP